MENIYIIFSPSFVVFRVKNVSTSLSLSIYIYVRFTSKRTWSTDLKVNLFKSRFTERVLFENISISNFTLANWNVFDPTISNGYWKAKSNPWKIFSKVINFARSTKFLPNFWRIICISIQGESNIFILKKERKKKKLPTILIDGKD